MPVILKSHVHFNSKTDGEALIRPGEMTTGEAASLAGCSMENIRQWIKKHRIGRWEPRLQMYVVDREKLLARMKRRKPKQKPLAEAK
jgi:excisionase family DNA binding protein